METTDPLRKAAESLLAPTEQPEEVVADEPEVEVTEEDGDPEISEAVEDEAPESENEGETDDAEADAEDHEQPERLTVKVDGNEVEVTLDDLKRAYSGQAHIQRGMQEAAEHKKQAQAILEALQSEQARFMEFAQSVQQNGLKTRPIAPDPSLAKTDPIQYVEEYANYQSAQTAYESEQAEMRRYSQAQSAVAQQQHQSHMAEQLRILESKIPGYADPQKGKEVREALRKTGEAYGYSATELESIGDARAVQVLHDAMQWQKLQAAKTQPKVATPKNVKPKASRPEPAQLARARLIEKAKKSGDLKDWAATLLE